MTLLLHFLTDSINHLVLSDLCIHAMLSPLVIPEQFAYYRNLHWPKTIDNMRYRFRGKAIIYGIRCRVTNMIYIGSTFTPVDRFRQHLVTGHSSNQALQDAIAKYSLAVFNVYIFKVVVFPKGLTSKERELHLFAIEQSYINQFPKDRLYNAQKSFSGK
jgi:hypothetical protein